MEIDTKSKRVLKRYGKKKKQNPIQFIQGLDKWIKWISSIGKVGEVKDWSSNKKEIVKFLNDLKDNTEHLELSESTGQISPVEFYTMLAIQLKKLKETLYQLIKLNVIHRNDFLYIVSIVDDIIEDNRDIIEKLEEEEILIIE
jgi:hypothetical protein